MKYKLYETTDPTLTTTQQVLVNRGVCLDDQDAWMRGYDDETFDQMFNWRNLSDIETTASVFIDELQKDDCLVYVVVDCDCDGVSSAAIVMNFIRRLGMLGIGNDAVVYGVHAGKQHGLADMMDDILENSPTMVIVPDAGSNDYEQHAALKERGIQCIVLDHHESQYKSKDAVVVNNQFDDGFDHNMTGSVVAWMFTLCVQEMYNLDAGAENFCDLAGFGALSDMAPYSDVNMRALFGCGLGDDSTVTNPFLDAMCRKNAYNMGRRGGLTYMSYAFYVSPFVNAVWRSGTVEERRLLVDAFLEWKDQSIVDSAVNMTRRVKERQTSVQKEATELADGYIAKNALDSLPVLPVVLPHDSVSPTVCGLVANQLQSKYKKPTFVLMDCGDSYSGSARNYSMSEIKDFKTECERASEGLQGAYQGHQGAFGTTIAVTDFEAVIDALCALYADVDTDPCYFVDYDFGSFPDRGTVLEIGAHKDWWGQQMPEPYVAVEGVELNKRTVQLLSPDKNPTLKITTRNGVEVMKFKSSREEYDDLVSGGKTLTAVCTCSVNEWNGTRKPQLIVEDYEVEEGWQF